MADFVQEHHSGFSLAESKMWQEVSKRPASAEEFEAVMLELFAAEVSRFFGSLNTHMLLAQTALHLWPVLDPTAANDPSTAHTPLQLLGKMKAETREAYASSVVAQLTPQLIERISKQLAAAEQYKWEQKQKDGIDKFSSMILGPSALFNYGLEKILPFPDKDVLAAMEREHTEVEGDSNTEFKAWNDGKERTTTPKAEWEQVLPNGRDQRINGRDYEGQRLLCEDFEKHELVLKAGMKKAECVAVRLYTGPMFRKYNDWLRKFTNKLDARLKAGEKELESAIQGVLDEMEAGYPNTLHALNSALVKISAITPLPPGSVAFRGQAGLDIPPCFLNPDEYGCRAGVEGGFMSTSTDKKVLLHHHPIISSGLPVAWVLLLSHWLGVVSADGTGVHALRQRQPRPVRLLPCAHSSCSFAARALSESSEPGARCQS
jgi:hypothetical protein